LFEPQTSGGLLAAVQPARAESTLQRLHEAGYTSAGAIGEIVAVAPGDAPVIYSASHGGGNAR
jgi:selenide, water dikinase